MSTRPNLHHRFCARVSRPASPSFWVWAAPVLGLMASGCAAPAPEATKPRTVVVSKATCQPTTYPDVARRQGAAGQTEVELEVNAEGKVTRVAIVKSSGSTPGHLALDALALNTIAKCTFPPEPGFLSGTGRMVYVWRLDG